MIIKGPFFPISIVQKTKIMATNPLPQPIKAVIPNSENDQFISTAVKEANKAKKLKEKALRAEQWKNRAIAVGLSPENIDCNKVMKLERCKKLGVDSETSYKELDYLESRNALLAKAKALKINLEAKGLDTPQINLQKLEEVIYEADDELSRKITCLGLSLDKNTSWDKINEIRSNIEDAENMMLNEGLARFAKSGRIGDIRPKPEEQNIVFLDDIDTKCNQIADDIKKGNIPIELIDELLEAPEKHAHELQKLFKVETSSQM